ncbi:MAG: maleylpyruvate isomerase N-terminal domain-containing protein [Anaerolineae bacterium]|nr:maleylpyruvate isomerase N-terminal domain-containing protein [Anaerolineae bacterium]
MSERIEKLVARLEKGQLKMDELFHALAAEEWDATLYVEPYRWSVRDLAAHLLSAEEGLLRIAQDIAAGGSGAPQGFDYNGFNAQEQQRLAGIPPQALLEGLRAARRQTVDWVKTLDETALEREGHHPALGTVKLEVLINAIYGHQLMHARDLKGA